MKNGNLIFSAVQFLFITALFGVGAVFFVLHYIPGAKLQLSEWVLRGEPPFVFLGSMLACIGLFLTICFAFMQRHQYIRLQSYFVDENYVRDAVSMFWDKELSELPKPIDIYFAKEKIEIITKLPGNKEDLKKIEKRLGKFLSSQLGYKREFFVSFRSR